MKHFALTVASFLMIANVAKADATPSMFETLLHQFITGTNVDFKPLVGKLDSGRCFMVQAPDQPIAAAMAVVNQVVDNGPLGSGQPQLQVSVSVDPNLTSDYFDHAKITDLNVDTQHMPITAVDAQTQQISLSNGSSLQFRASGSNVIGYGRAGWGDLTLMCYFYNLHN